MVPIQPEIAFRANEIIADFSLDAQAYLKNFKSPNIGNPPPIFTFAASLKKFLCKAPSKARS